MGGGSRWVEICEMDFQDTLCCFGIVLPPHLRIRSVPYISDYDTITQWCRGLQFSPGDVSRASVEPPASCRAHFLKLLNQLCNHKSWH